MYQTLNPMTIAVRRALALTAMTLIATTGAVAQTSEEEQARELDQVVVTGSRIRSQTLTSSAPVTEIGSEEITTTGATRIDDLVNQYPQLTPAFDSQTNNPSTGYATVSLRNLGAERTLTLVNGRRLPPGPSGELRDISIIPSALVSRVDLLTGGASAVYGSDAVAGVVNFILDTEFEGFSIGGGISGYQHNNDNEYMQNLQTLRGFTFEDGNSGLDGKSRNIDIAVGGRFADDRGHAMAWLTYRKNDALFHGQRDYASCALNAAGTACGGSATNATGNFLVAQTGVRNLSFANFNASNRWANGTGPAYNYAPPNYYQRPDERYTAGMTASFDVNEYVTPYMEFMFINRKDSLQIAESGAFNVALGSQNCNNPLFGSLCADLGLNPALPFTINVLRRNVEGGPRRSDTTDTSFRIVTGVKGQITDMWSYDASYLYARTSNDTQGFNDFLISRIASGAQGCPAGSFAGCIPWNVFRTGGVTAAAANALAGVSFNKTNTEMEVLNAFVTGDTGWIVGGGDAASISAVFGLERREESFAFVADNDSAAGNFAGAGSSSPPIDGQTKVNEFFTELLVPMYVGDTVSSVDLDLGYRYSDYDRSGGASTFKVGVFSEIGMFRPRVGFNRAIRAPGINDLFAVQRTALFSGADPCAGTTPAATREACARTGVSSAQYGNIIANPAGQNNQFIGGNPNLTPEEADTFTLGVVVSPLENLNVAVDYYDIKIEDTITGIGASTILDTCLSTGNPQICGLIRRGPNGDIWLADANNVINTTQNFGELRAKGLDLNVSYSFDALGGSFLTNFVGNYVLEEESNPIPGVEGARFDCAGVINPSCNTPEWRHIANIRYAYDRYSANLRWRYFGEVDYQSNDGVALTTDTLLAANGGISGQSFFDLSGTVALYPGVDVTLGINNIFDREPPLVGVDNALNANAPGGYDQLGRYLFSSFSIKF